MTTPEHPATTAPPAQEPPPAPADRWEDYIDVFISPAELFRRRAKSSLTHPVVTLALLSMIIYFVMLPLNSALFEANVQSPEAADFMEQWGGLFRIAGGLFVPVTVLVGVAFAAVLLWLGARVTTIDVALRDTFLIATFAAFIYLLQTVAAGLAVMLVDPPIDQVRDLSFGVLRFTGGDDMNPFLVALLGRFDVFVLWQAAVWAIGLRVLGRTTAGKAFTAAGIAWLLAGIPRAFMGLLPQPTATTTTALR